MSKRKINWKHVIETITMILCISVGIWFAASFIDTNIHNCPFSNGYGEFADWNIFNILFFN